MAQESKDTPQVGPVDPKKKNSPIAKGSPPKAQAKGPAAAKVCYWGGLAYGEGATVCSSHTRYICRSGEWYYDGSC